MYHFFDKIENKAGDGLSGYFARVINRSTQGNVALSSDENGTPIVVVSGVENMAKTDELGNVSLYVEPGTYHLDIYAPNTTSFLFRVSDVSMNATKGDTGDAGPTGVSDATFLTLAALKAIDPGAYPSPRLAAASGSDGGVANGPFAYQTGNFTGRADVVALNGVPLTTGALVRQSASGILTDTGDTNAVKRPQIAKNRELPRSPEDLGSLAAAVAAATTAPEHASVHLPAANYLVTATTVLDGQKVASLSGSSLYAQGMPANDVVLRIESTNESPLGNYFGYRASLDNVRIVRGGAIVGVGGAFTGIGVDMNASATTGAAQISSDRMAIAGHDVGLQFSNHAYNSTITNAEIWSNRIGVYWPAGGTDNGERNTFVGCTIHDNTYAWMNNEPGGSMQVLGGSSDFNRSQAKVNGGKLFFTSHHFESGQMGLADGYGFYAEGDGGLIDITGGWVLNQAEPMPIPTLCYVGAGAAIKFHNVFMHNIKLTRETADSPTAIFGGPGLGVLEGTRSFGATIFPDRLHQGRTSLVDMDGTDAAFKDMAWVSERTGGITSRLVSPNVTLLKSTSNPQVGARGYAIQKRGAAGAVPASAGLMWVPATEGQLAFGGFYYALNAADAGGAASQPINVVWLWATLDSAAPDKPPVFFNEIGIYGETLTVTSSYKMCAFGGGFGNRVAPAGVTHFVCRIDMDGAAPFTLNIGTKWIDAV